MAVNQNSAISLATKSQKTQFTEGSEENKDLINARLSSPHALNANDGALITKNLMVHRVDRLPVVFHVKADALE